MDGFPSLRLGEAISGLAEETAARTPAGVGDDVAAAIAWAAEVGAPLATTSRLTELWEALAAVAHRDVAAARILEPHVDALRILAEARADGFPIDAETLGAEDAATWGVFAAETPGLRLEARPVAGSDPGEWMLDGTKPWCSLAADLSHALVTAWIDRDRRGLFAVDLRARGVRPHGGPWHARGLAQVMSAPVDFAGARAVIVGEPGWYLRRTGFARGGMAVAACWWGAATALTEPLRAAATTERADQLALVHAGRVDAALWAARAVLSEAGAVLDRGAHLAETMLATRVRAAVVRAAELALDETDHALGPGPLVADERHARRAADLRLYLRQHHGDRDLARLGRDLVTEAAP